VIPSGRLVSFYGDDFSGSTDVMEVLAANGLETVLFLDVPEERQLGRFPDSRAIGIAGCSRSQSPAWMAANLPRIFQALQALQTPFCHYKVCSTFDSSAQIGSIGRALEIGQEIFGSSYVPLVVGAPALHRYCVFGNLFATVNGETHRLDRHPTMSRHPVTPMAESDLRLHLAAQTSKRIGLLDILALRSEEPSECLQRLVSQGSEVILFDVLDEDSLRQTGKVLWNSRSQPQSFLVGSSGVEYALTAWWRSSGLLPPPVEFPSAGETDRIIVVSGSGSPVTESQIRWAMSRGGFGSIAIDVLRLLEHESAAAESARVQLLALAELEAGRSVVLHTTLGPSDARLLEGSRHNTAEFQERLGLCLGQLLREMLLHSSVRRAVICGGDTSARAGSQLGIFAVTTLKPLAPGSPLCLTWSDNPRFDGLEIVFKGGQVGGKDFFGLVLRGG
jgi:3-oxoisoapionate kinase